METNYPLIICLIAWIVIIATLIRSRFKKNIPSVGLVIAFVFAFSLEHWFGALIYTFPWFLTYDYSIVISGFIKSTYALMAYAFGSIVLAPFLIKAFRFGWLEGKSYIPDPNLPRIYLLIGFIFYFALEPILSGIASVRTLVYSSWNLLIVGICLGCWNSWRMKRRRALTYWLMFAGIAPFFTMITGGFLGVGTMTLMAILCFVAVFYRPRWSVFLIALLAVYLGLSLFVNYMDYRTELRDAVWGGRPMAERMEVVSKMLRDFEFINLRNEKHLGYVDARLNQNYLVGAVIDNMQGGYEQYARGETVLHSLLAIIPRVLWQRKFLRLGGSALVTRYTGLEFAADVSVAMGLVMEFYINFGTIGIIIGFLLVGAIVTIIDIACAYRLEQGNWQGFTYWFLPAMSFIACTSLVQITMTMAASIIFCLIINKFILPQLGTKRILR